MANINKSSTSGAARLQERAKATRGQSLIRYPSDLFSPGAEPFIIFNIFDAVARGGDSKGKIAMYMPPTLRVNYHAEYEEVSLDWEKWKVAVGETFSGGGADTILRGAINAGQTLTNANVRDSFEQFTGKTVNPHMALLFRGVGFRTFQFDFQLMAKNEAESNAIRDIIALFKFHMHPEIDAQDSNRWFQYPENFTIELFSPTEEYLFKVGTCALTDVSVDYAGSGVPSFFTKTGAPVDIRMSLQFKELAIVTKDLIKKNGF